MKKLKISVFELVVYIIIGLMAVWGLTYIGLGVACNFINETVNDNALLKANAHLVETTSYLGFLKQGILVLTIAIVVIVIVLLANAKKSDKEFEKSQRRAARTSQRANKVIDAEVSEVDDNK